MSSTAAQTRRAFAGPAFLTQGFRPFFLLGALWSATALGLWVVTLHGDLSLPSHFAPLAWHVHEMLYGFLPAIIAGFMLTAIPNWTGSLPIRGTPLLMLVLLWLAGRVAIAASAWIGAAGAAVVDLAFLAVLASLVLREILAGRNWRNLPMVAALLLLLAGNAMMHLKVGGELPDEALGWRIGISVTAMLISLVGGRIIPSFTRNWLAKRGPGPLPEPFGLFDKLTLGGTGIALALWIVMPEAAATGGLLLLAGLLQAARLARWCGQRTLSEPLLWILHLAYAWLPLGILLLGATLLVPEIPASLALHALTVGAFGTITLAVMTRATLGHTGRALTADAATTAIYLAVFVAALTRICAALLPEQALPLLGVSGLAWIAAFGGFALVYGRYLLRRCA